MRAAQDTTHLLKTRGHGTGGIILLDKTGHPGFAFNTPRMAYGYVSSDGSFSVAI
jgi:beta-aspartyl-peptidase (threonine type)